MFSNSHDWSFNEEKKKLQVVTSYKVSLIQVLVMQILYSTINQRVDTYISSVQIFKKKLHHRK